MEFRINKSYISYSKGSEDLEYAEEPPACFVVATGEDLFEGCLGCLGVDQTEAESVLLQGGRGDTLLRRMSSSPNRTWFHVFRHAIYCR